MPPSAVYFLRTGDSPARFALVCVWRPASERPWPLVVKGTMQVRNRIKPSIVTALILANMQIHGAESYSQGRKVSISSDTANPVVLDIIETDEGMVGIPGEFIFFRLYQNGRVEFEDLHDTPSKFVKHELQISKKELEEFLTNARQPDFLNSTPRYNLIERYTDMWTLTRIDFKYDGHNKQIELINYMPWREQPPGYYPAALISIMQAAWKIRKENHRPQ
jgi:hypothetical protein